MTLRNGSSIKRGDLLVIAQSTRCMRTSGGTDGYSTARLAVATSVSRDGRELRAYSDACGGSPVKWCHEERAGKVWAVVPNGPAEACAAFQYRHTYQDRSYGSSIVVFGPGGDAGMIECARYLRNAVEQWTDTGQLPVGHNPSSPEAVHLDRPSTPASRAAAETMRVDR